MELREMLFFSFTFLLGTNYIFSTIVRDIKKNTLLIEKLDNIEKKLLSLDRKIETLEDFRLKIYDKNFIFTERRNWEVEEMETDYDDDYDEEQTD